MKDGSATLKFVYDGAERLTEFHEVTGPNITRLLKVLTYGASNANGNWALGKLESATRTNYVDLATLIGQEIPRIYEVTERFTYAGLGGRLSSRLTEVLEGTTSQASFQLAMEWDDLGQRIGLTYPATSGTATRLVEYAYSFGYLTAISSDAIFDAETTEGIETQISYHPNGLVHLIQHDSGRKETHTADPTGPARPGRIEVLEGGTTTLWTTGDYRYDGAGNIVEMGDSWYRYDGVSRLVEAHVSTSPTATGSLVAQSYQFDGFGNLQSIGGSPGRATPTSKVSNRLESGVYDNRGNLTGWISTTYRYDALGSMWRTTAGAEDWVYLYNADGERILAKKLGGDTHHRWSLRDTTGQVLRDYLESGNPVAWSVEKDYLYRGDKLLASESPAGITEYHLDHLGTPRAISKNGGSLTFHTYLPFGEEAVPSLDLERMKFTGHERDLGDPNGTGDDLDYMHARFCSPVTGRFLAVDPARESAESKIPQSWNRFSYVRNNPLKYVDLDGKVITGALEAGHDIYVPTPTEAKVLGSILAVSAIAVTAVVVAEAAPAILGFFLRPDVAAGFAAIAAELAGQGAPTARFAAIVKGTAPFTGRQVAHFERQLSTAGAGSLLKSRATLSGKIAEHLEAIEKYSKDGGFASSLEREIRNFAQQINAIDHVLTSKGGFAFVEGQLVRIVPQK